LSSFFATDGVLEDNKPVWTGNQAFQKSVTKFRGYLTKSTGLVTQMSIGTKGATEVKGSKRDVMIAQTLVLGGKLHAFATDAGDTELAAKTDVTASDLRKLRDGEVGSACHAIQELVEAHVADLTDDGVTAADVTALQQAINDYSGVTGKPRQKRTENSAAIGQLSDVVRRTRGVLEGELDKRMLQFQVSAPEFYESYVNSRRIVDNRGAHAAKNGNGNNTPQPPQP
jgi:hypothetical protein